MAGLLGNYGGGSSAPAYRSQDFSKGCVMITRSPLTDREREVAQMVSEAKSNKEIAFLLGLTYESTKQRVSRILSKLHLANRVALAIYWTKYDPIDE